LQRHAPVQKLEPGVYWLSFPAGIRGRPDVVRRAIETSFTVEAGIDLPVPMPELRGFRWAEASAVFELWLPKGMLVADFGDEDEDPMESIQLQGPRDGLYRFRLGSSACSSNLQVTGCMRSRVRFGALSGAGKFSGWTGSFDVQFPGQNCTAAMGRAAVGSSATPQRASSMNSLWLPGAVLAAALVALAAGLWRRHPAHPMHGSSPPRRP
jgi:hypothetical protein